ncbi:aminopeptidase [Patescibacteria group bacterium]|nr:aminopeptidase [Patescibacteria group bacterium]
MYTPSEQILERYAQVLINFALNSGKGVKRGEVVLVQVPECAKPMYVPLRDTVLKAGAYPIMQYLPDGVQADRYYSLASHDQLIFFPEQYFRGLVDQCDHSVAVIAEYDKYELKEVDPKKILERANSMKPYREWRDKKEAAGKFTWTLGMYGTLAMAKDAKMTLEEYWQEIIVACYLDQPDPIAAWRKTFTEIKRIQSALNKLEIDYLHLEADGIDLKVGIGPNRRWLGGGGRNIPSFELFISPDWRKTEGKIAFNQPLYRYGNVIEDISLRFRNGQVVEATAKKNEKLLKEMIASENADKIGEFSLTDSRFSRITKVMGETLFDENMGGPEGNTHLALGNAYKDSYPDVSSTVSDKQWDAMGYNESPVHTDIVSTLSRTVTAFLADGTRQVIYEKGKFLL